MRVKESHLEQKRKELGEIFKEDSVGNGAANNGKEGEDEKESDEANPDTYGIEAISSKETSKVDIQVNNATEKILLNSESDPSVILKTNESLVNGVSALS